MTITVREISFSSHDYIPPTERRQQESPKGSTYQNNNMQREDEKINVWGARVHNLKNIDVMIPRGSLTVITGLSGSGKSSLAFDTIFAEGQRRYIETFSAYARNFLGNMERPDVDKITGLSPVISIEQKRPTTIPVPRSARQQRYMTICVFSMHVPERPIATFPAKRW